VFNWHDIYLNDNDKVVTYKPYSSNYHDHQCMQFNLILAKQTNILRTVLYSYYIILSCIILYYVILYYIIL